MFAEGVRPPGEGDGGGRVLPGAGDGAGSAPVAVPGLPGWAGVDGGLDVAVEGCEAGF